MKYVIYVFIDCGFVVIDKTGTTSITHNIFESTKFYCLRDAKLAQKEIGRHSIIMEMHPETERQ